MFKKENFYAMLWNKLTALSPLCIYSVSLSMEFSVLKKPISVFLDACKMGREEGGREWGRDEVSFLSPPLPPTSLFHSHPN